MQPTEGENQDDGTQKSDKNAAHSRFERQLLATEENTM